MAFTLNRAQIIGNATRDCEARQTPQGRTVANFGVATNLAWKDASGVQQTKAEFHNIVVWGKLAEICGQYVKKGRKMFVEGRLQTRDWEGDDGVKRSRTEIVADQVILLDRPAGAMNTGDLEKDALGSSPRELADPFADLSATLSKKPSDDIAIEDLPF